MTSGNKDLLNVRNLKTHFYTSMGEIKAVDGVDLDVSEREKVGIVGESGCGKSTLAFSVLRLIPSPGRILGGKILFKGKNLLELPERAMKDIRGKEISIVFQDPSTYLNPVMKVKDQIAEAILLHQTRDQTEVRKKVIEALEKVRIYSPSKVAEYYPHQLSGGMQQRVLIAMAISCNPSLLVADEPTTSLDVTVQIQILDLIRQLTEELRSSLLLITHDLAIIAEVCDKVYVMYAGKIIEYADVFSLFERPKHPYTIGLLKSALSIDEFKETLVTIDGTVPNLINPPKGCRFHPRCPQAKATCLVREPSLLEIESGHGVSCWLYS